MTAAEFAESKMQTLAAAGAKNISVKGHFIPCELAQGSIGYELFSRQTISDTQEVVTDWDRRVMRKGVMIWISYIKPRCRKATLENFYTALA